MPTSSVGRISGCGARTRACRVDNPVDTVVARRKCSHECEHGTHECVRHKYSYTEIRKHKQLQQNCGVTLIELLVVVALISLMVGISFPALTSGIDSLRLNAATNSIVSFLNSGLDRAERRQKMVEITVSKATNSLEMRSTEAAFHRTLA